MTTLINTDQLKQLTGYTRSGDIERCLDSQGVKYLHGKNGPITTLDALNNALGIKTEHNDKSEKFEFAQ
jgi:hypothetical protein